MGWSVRTPAWAVVLAPIAMWAPALGRYAARHTVDRGFTSTLALSRWGETGAQVILYPLAVPLAVYGVAYAAAWSANGLRRGGIDAFSVDAPPRTVVAGAGAQLT